MRNVLILDTSILCVWLEVPDMDSCGPDTDKWNRQRVMNKIKTEEKDGTIFVLPIASLIETGNHIAQSKHSRRERGQALAELMKKSANEESPWAAFSEQSALWSSEMLVRLADAWPDMAAKKLTLGDATIKNVAEYYAQMGYRVEILTGDAGLKAYEPAIPLVEPRRRRNR